MNPIQPNNPIDAAIFINHTERSVVPTQDAGKVPKLEPNGGLDSRFLDYNNDFWVPMPTTEPMNGLTTPVPVRISPRDGTIVRASAVDAGRVGFNGFVNLNTELIVPRFLTSQVAGTSLTAPAGTDRVIIVMTFHFGNTRTIPSAVSWGGTNMTLVANFTTGGSGALASATAWLLPIGTSATPQTNSFSVTGGSGDQIDILPMILIYENIQQTAGVAAVGGTWNTASSAGSVTTGTSVRGNEFARFVVGGAITLASVPTIGAINTRIQQSRIVAGDLGLLGDASFSMTSGGSSGLALVAFNLTGSMRTVPVKIKRRLGGFSGLLPGRVYFIQNDIGVIGLPAGTNPIVAGVARSNSELELLI